MKKEIQLIDLKEKIKKAEEEEDAMQTWLYSLIFGFLVCSGLAIFIWYKQILDEGWYYGTGLFSFLALIALILIPFAYKKHTKASKELKELKKQEKELKNSL